MSHKIRRVLCDQLPPSMEIRQGLVEHKTVAQELDHPQP